MSLRQKCLRICIACSLLSIASQPEQGLVCAVAHAEKARKKKRVKMKPMPTEEKLATTLNERRDAIQQCAINHALTQGASRVDVVTRVTINSRGQVADSQIKVTVTGGAGDRVRECVDGVIRSIRFPRSDAPLITIERTWTVAAN